MRAARWSSFALAVLSIFLVSIQGGRHPHAVVQLYRLTFNDTPPFGPDEDENGICWCTTHGSEAATSGVMCCESSLISPMEGDGVFRHDGTASVFPASAWCNVFDAQTDFWVEFWFYLDEDGTPTSAYMPQLLKSNCGAAVGSGYGVRIGNSFDNQLILVCDGTTKTYSQGYIDQVWRQYKLHFDLDAGTTKIWRRQAGGNYSVLPQETCDGTGGDTGTPATGFLLRGDSPLDEYGIDDFNVYDEDPGR
jgi:hypothetical protein